MKRKSKDRTGSAASARLTHEAEGTASGALAGAVVGAAAGPPGIVAGAVIGAVAGTLAGAALDSASSAQALRSRELDEQIGVQGGEIGAPNLKHPPTRVGAFSSASAGAGSASDETPAEGPMQEPDE